MSFNKNFIWGVASAAYQIEGAYNEDGKGLSVWDAYTQESGHVIFGENGNVACDHYHHYKEDVAQMKALGIKMYRFSISWTRVLPNGVGEVNEKGIQFYSDLIDELIANGIEPLITVFHWDYPLALHYKGGWLNDESSEWFAQYTALLVERFSDRVKYWITINEPQIFIGFGYQVGRNAPFQKCNNADLVRMSHNVLLSHGKAVKVIRENAVKKPIIGYAPTGTCVVPSDNSTEEIEKARAASFDMNDTNYLMSNAWWSDPIFFGKYAERGYEIFKAEIDAVVKDGDMEIICQPLDFYGVNIYSAIKPLHQAYPKTLMGWGIVPEALYWAPKFFYERYGLPVLMTENGMAGHDWVHLDGKVHDPYRIDYISRYLSEYKRAAENGVELMGYLYWSIMDNFEWADGYDKRFGLVYIDYPTQKRIPKESAYWYAKLIESNGENLK